MKVEHKLNQAEKRWGYLWWKKADDDAMKKLFPDGKFTVDILGKKISDRQVDWKQKRIYLGTEELGKIRTGRILLLQRTPRSDVIKITKR